MELQPLFYNEERVLTSSQLANYYKVDTKILNNNYLRNKDKYIEGIHYHKLMGDSLKEFKEGFPQIDEQLKYTSAIFLWTERGCLFHSKSLGTDEAWGIYESLVDTYFRAKEVTVQLEGLSPQLKVLINMELKQKELEKKQRLLEEENKKNTQNIEQLTGKVENIKNIITLTPQSEWRKSTNKIVNAIVIKYNSIVDGCNMPDDQKLAQHINHKTVRDEMYKELNKRGKVDIYRRLLYKSKRMVAAGASNSDINNLNYLDIIAEDVAVTQLFLQVVKEFAIKHDIDISKL